MDDPIYSYFHENLATVSNEELLKALGNALLSADYWRQACLVGFTSTPSERQVGIESDLHNTK